MRVKNYLSKNIVLFMGVGFLGLGCSLVLPDDEDTGACLRDGGGCVSEKRSECLTGNGKFYKGKSCKVADPLGACIAFEGGCEEKHKSECGTSDQFSASNTCDEVDPSGACVDDVSGGCRDNISASKCEAELNTIYAGDTCDEVDPFGACELGFECQISRKSECDLGTFTVDGTCN